MSHRFALLMGLLGALLAVRAHAQPPSAAPPACGDRIQVFDGVSSVLRCGLPGGLPGNDGSRLLPEGAPVRMAGPALRLLGLPVDVNRASVEDLEALPGVGPKLAERIAAARPFQNAAGLRGVAGIGPKRFAELKAAVVVGTVGQANASGRKN